MSPWIRLARLDKPTGYWLLLFPGWWSVALNTPHGQWPSLKLMILFFAGAVVMRAAGCCVNDVADREFDRRTERTRARPVACGEISVKAALIFAALLTLAGLLIVWQMGLPAVLCAAASLPLILAYPFMKRVTWWPQAFLGVTFNWGALVGSAAAAGTLTLPALILYVAGFFWTLGYDTIYAFQDIGDDEKTGVKSTARRLGRKARRWVSLWYGIFWLLLIAAGHAAQLGFGFYVGMGIVFLELTAQLNLWRMKDPHSSLTAFRANTILGWYALFSILAGLASPAIPFHHFSL